jgi:lysophospholipase L1-like esterase
MGKRLLFIGDSLIEYFDWAGRFPDHDVYNFGIAGETVNGLYARLKRVFREVKDPDLVFIMSGINNLAMADADFIDAYRDVIRDVTAQYPSAKVSIQSLLPVLFPYISNEDIRHMNKRLEHLAADERVGYLDIHSRFLDQKGSPIEAYLMSDGVHVSDEGYRIWSGEIEKLLK